MANYLSPSVNITESDNTLRSSPASISVASGVITTGWGEVLTPQYIDNENTLVNIFGQPNDNNYKNWMCIANYLAYASGCYVVRMETHNQFNANAKGLTGWRQETIENAEGETIPVVDEDGNPFETRVGLVINNENQYAGEYENGNGDFGEFAARYPGSLGNSIMVTYADSATFDRWIWTDGNGGVHDWRAEFNSAPGTSRYATARDGKNDEIHLLVIDAGGAITGTKGTILEKYEYLSKASNSRDYDGVSNHYKRILKDQSEYVYVMDYPSTDLLVPAYDKRVKAIAYTTEEIDNITGIQKGDIILDLQAQTVLVGARVTEIDDTGVRRTITKPTYNAMLSDWADAKYRVFNERDGQIYDVVYDGSKNATVQQYIYDNVANWGSTVENTVFASMKEPYTVQLSGGSDDYEYSDGDEIAAWDTLNNKEAYDFGICITGAATPTVAKYVIENICESRIDCVAFVSPTTDDRGPFLGNITSTDREDGITSSELKILNDTINYRTQSSFNVNSSYGHLDSGWKYQYDKYGDVNRWVPLNGDCAGLYAQTDETVNQWTPAAGYNRGQIKNVIRLNYSPNKIHRDQLYPQQINPVVTFAGEGTILYGTKSLLTKPSALDRLHVRRLMIYLEKTIADSMKYLLFELNNASTRAYAVNIVDPILRTVLGQQGIERYSVTCDTSNNTADVINSNTLRLDIRIIPTKCIDFIDLVFTIDKSGSTSFTEITA